MTFKQKVGNAKQRLEQMVQPNPGLKQDFTEFKEGVAETWYAFRRVVGDRVEPITRKAAATAGTFIGLNAAVSAGILAARVRTPDNLITLYQEHPIVGTALEVTLLTAAYCLSTYQSFKKTVERAKKTEDPSTNRTYVKTGAILAGLGALAFAGTPPPTEYTRWQKAQYFLEGDYVATIPANLLPTIPSMPRKTVAGSPINELGYQVPTKEPWTDVEERQRVTDLYGIGRANRCDPPQLQDNIDDRGRYVAKGRARGGPHNGVDIVNPVGTPVYPMTPGVIEKAMLERNARTAVERNNGNHIIFRTDDGLKIFYLHLQEQDFASGLQQGDRVDYETMVGRIGTSGNASETRPHLHVQVQENGRNVNPLKYITGCTP